MAIDRILLKLTEPQDDHAKIVHQGRLGFLEWLVSLPDDEDFRQQALIAYARASPLQMVVPAVGVLCDLLEEAAQEHSEATGQATETLLQRHALSGSREGSRECARSGSRRRRSSRNSLRSGARGCARGGARSGNPDKEDPR